METTKVKFILSRIIWMFSAVVSSVQATEFTTVGSDVTLPCSVNFDYPSWGDVTNDVNYNFGGYSTFKSSIGDKVGRLAWAADKRGLIIQGSRFTDTAQYQCYQSTKNNEFVSLEVRGALQIPEILNTKLQGMGSVVRGTENTLLTLTCISRGGKPQPTVTWSSGSSSFLPLSPTTTTPTTETDSTITVTTTYTFTPTRTNDLAQYYCRVTYNSALTTAVSASVFLYLNLQPSTPTLTTISTPVTEGQHNVQIGQCSTSGFRPRDGISLSWRVGGATVQGTGTIQSGIGETFSYTGSITKSVTRQDNGQVTCTINHGTLSSPLAATGILKVTFAALNVTLTGNSSILANGNNKVELACITSTANPPANISWSRNGSPIDNTYQVHETAGGYGGKITSQALVLTPTRDNDGDVYRCTASNTVKTESPVMSRQKVLDLKYHPIVSSKSGPTSPVTEGQTSNVFKCNDSSNPTSTVTWYHENINVHESTSPVSGTVYSYTIPMINRTHAGLYRCLAKNSITPTSQGNISVTVNYTPDVSVTTRNVTTQAKSVDIVCNPSGVPDQYTFSPWTHQWDINGPVLNHPGLGNSRVLRLTNLTYEHSGVYTCTVSNGVNCTRNPDAGSGYVNLVVKAAPVLISPQVTCLIRLTSKVNSIVIFNFTFWSNTENTTVQCYRNINVVHGNSPVGTLTLTTVPVMLAVFSSSVTTTGTLATLVLEVQQVDDFGQYVIVTSNHVGQAAQTLTLGIEAQGPPQLPTLDSVIALSQILAVWTPGFHGGLDQTVVIQTSTDRIHWDNNTAVFVGKKPDTKPFVTELSGLGPSTTYNMRLFAYNEEGWTGVFTDVFNVTTNEGTSVPECSQINVGVVAGLNIAVLMTLIMVGFAYVCFKKQYCKCRQTNNKKEEDLVMTESTNIYERTNTPDRIEHVYTGLQQQGGESTQRERFI